MRYTVLTALAIALLVTGCAWFGEMFDRHPEMARFATIPMQDAVRTAEAAVPGGKAIEADLTKENDRVVYEIDVLDNTKSTRTVFVDAKSGLIIKSER